MVLITSVLTVFAAIAHAAPANLPTAAVGTYQGAPQALQGVNEQMSVIDAIRGNGQLSQVLQGLQMLPTRISQVLGLMGNAPQQQQSTTDNTQQQQDEQQQITIFVPSNNAIAALPSWVTNVLSTPAARPLLRAWLMYHVVAGTVQQSQFMQNVELPSGNSNGLAATDGLPANIDQNFQPPASKEQQTQNQQQQQTSTDINPAGTVRSMLADVPLYLWRDAADTLRVNDARIIAQARVRNAVIYVVDRILEPSFLIKASLYRMPNNPLLQQVIQNIQQQRETGMTTGLNLFGNTQQQ